MATTHVSWYWNNIPGTNKRALFSQGYFSTGFFEAAIIEAESDTKVNWAAISPDTSVVYKSGVAPSKEAAEKEVLNGLLEMMGKRLETVSPDSNDAQIILEAQITLRKKFDI